MNFGRAHRYTRSRCWRSRVRTDSESLPLRKSVKSESQKVKKGQWSDEAPRFNESIKFNRAVGFATSNRFIFENVKKGTMKKLWGNCLILEYCQFGLTVSMQHIHRKNSMQNVLDLGFVSRSAREW